LHLYIDFYEDRASSLPKHLHNSEKRPSQQRAKAHEKGVFFLILYSNATLKQGIGGNRALNVTSQEKETMIPVFDQ
jgi:hypothetical protein